jgi:hypothetical protein
MGGDKPTVAQTASITSQDRPGLPPFSACNVEKSREWPGDEANFIIIQGEPERAPNTRETGSGVYIYIIYLFICA